MPIVTYTLIENNAREMLEPHLKNLPAEVSKRKAGNWEGLRYYNEKTQTEYIISVKKKKGKFVGGSIVERRGVDKSEMKVRKQREAVYKEIAAYSKADFVRDLIEVLESEVDVNEKKKAERLNEVIDKYSQRSYSMGIVRTCKAAKIEPEFLRLHNELMEAIKKEKS